MKPVPMNVMTLYADLLQRLDLQDIRPGSISTKKVGGKQYLYAVHKDGQTRIQRFIGPADDPQSQHLAKTIRQAADHARELRNTVTLLKNARVPSPTLLIGRILEVVANAGLFKRGLTLVGTAAYQTYTCAIGAYLPASVMMTNDIDFSVAEFVASDDEEDIEHILKRADPSFVPRWSNEDKLPKVFVNSTGFSVDILTSFGRGRKSPVQIEPLKCAAEALSFQEYPAEATIEAAALYNAGVLVRVPQPARYAVHKLIVAQQRKPEHASKRKKDLLQASEMIDIFLATNEIELQDTLDEARNRGKAWKTAINASLKEIGRDARQGRLPLPTALSGAVSLGSLGRASLTPKAKK